MNFYCLRASSNLKIVGTYPPIISADYPCDVWNEKRFTQSIDFEKINFEPIVAKPILRNGAKKIDYFQPSIVGFQFKPIISTKLYGIIKKFENLDLQFFPCQIIHKNLIYTDYYISIPTAIRMDYVDYSNSTITERRIDENGLIEKLLLSFSSSEHFLNFKNLDKNRDVYISKLAVLPTVKRDFFCLKYTDGGVRFIVSERLMVEIETSKITGIEFQPLSCPFDEWLNSDERAKTYGK